MSLLKEVKQDNQEKVLELLQQQQDINQFDQKSGASLLQLAIQNQNLTILTELLRANGQVNVNIANKKNGSTPLQEALMLNDVQAIELLLKYKADCKQLFSDGTSYLHFAVAQNTPQILALLIKHGTPLNIIAPSGSALHVAINKNNIENAIYLIQETNISLDGTDQDGENIIHLCALEGSGDILNAILIKAKNDQTICQQINRLVNQTNKEGNTPLHLAAQEEKTLIISLLLKATHIKVDENKENKAGLTYNQILEQQKIEKLKEKEEIQQRKKLAQEEKNIRNQQRRQEIIEKNKRDEEEQKHKKLREEQAIETLKGQDKRTRVVFILVIILVFILFYLSFSMGIKKKEEQYL